MPTPALRRNLFVIALLAASSTGRLDAAAGDLDCTFDGDGRVIANFASLELAQDIEVLANGSIVTIASAGTDLRLSRFLANGALDATFGGTGSILHTFAGFTFGGADFVSSSVAFDRDSAGNFLVVGSAIVTGGDREVWVGRFTPAGALDTTFGGGDGWVSFDWSAASDGSGNALDNAFAIAVDASDRPVVGGTLDLNGPVFNPSDSDMGIARLTTAGVLDTTFDGDGIALVTSGVIDDELRELAIDPSGRIVAVGNRWPISGARDSLIVRLTATGALDTSFDGDGIRIFDLTQTGSNTIAIGDDFAVDLDFAPGSPASIVITGYSVNTPTVARFDDTGAVDPSFGGGDGVVHVEFEVGAQDVLEHVMVQPDGKILVAGWPILGTNFQFSVMRLEADGDLDPTWAGDGRQTFNMVNVDRAYAAALMTDSRVVIAGSSTNDTVLVIARLLGDATPITATTATITGDAPDPTIPGQSFLVDVAVQSTTGSAAPTGNVTVGDGGTFSICSLAPGSGTTSTVSCGLTLNNLGNRTLTANYPGDAGQFCPSTSAIELHQVVAAPPAPSTTTIVSDAPDPSVIGQTVTVAYTVTSDAGSPAGSVTVSDDAAGVSCSSTVAVGQCSLALPAAGIRTLTASFAGNSSFAASSGSTGHQVNPAPTTTTITSDAPDPSVVGQAVTVAYTVTSSAGTPAGQVFVTTDGPETCTSTVAAGQCTITLTAPGARTLTVVYEGNVSFESSSATTAHQVDPAPTTTTIVSDSPDPSSVGQAVNVTYTVTSSAGTPTGDVTVSSDGGAATCTASVAAGQCSLLLGGPGLRTITATYAGNSSFATSSATTTSQVDPAPTTTTITSDDPDPSVVGQPVTVIYSVTSPFFTPVGNVTITATGGSETCTATVADGQCSLTLTAPGTRTLTANYSGSLTLAPSSSSGTAHSVNLATTTTTLTGDTPDPSLPGATVATTWTVVVDPPGVAAPTGTVTLTVSGGGETCSAPASAGGCSLALTALGNRTLTASYAGDPATTASSDDEPHEVAAAASTTTIVSHLPDPSVTGQSIDVSFTVSSPSGTPTGTVTVSDGLGGSCSGPLVAGAGSCSFAPATAGIRTITASYPGDGQIAGSTATAPHAVVLASTTLALQGIAPEPSAAGQPAAIAFAVAVQAPGAGTPNGFVTVTSGALACTAPLADGVCSLTWPDAGTYEVTAIYSGDPNYSSSQTATATSHTVTGAGQVAEIPTLGEWGLIAMGLGLSLAARRALRRGGAPGNQSRPSRPSRAGRLQH